MFSLVGFGVSVKNTYNVVIILLLIHSILYKEYWEWVFCLPVFVGVVGVVVFLSFWFWDLRAVFCYGNLKVKGSDCIGVRHNVRRIL